MIFEKKYIINKLTNLSIIFFLLRATIFNELIFTLLGILTGSVIFFIQLKKEILPNSVLIFILLSILISLFTLINNDFSRGFVFLPLTIASIGIAWSIHTNGINHKFVLTIFYILALYFVINVLYLNTDPDLIYSNSRNHISVMFINLFSLLVISSYLNKLRINFFHCLILLLCSIISIGASGILISSFIFIMLFQYRYLNFLTKNIIIFIIINSLIFLIFILMWPLLSEFIYLNFELGSDVNVKYSKSLQDTFTTNIRYLIIKEYYLSLSTYDLIFGVPLNYNFSALLKNYNFGGLSNPHNSFIVLHSRGGIILFPYLIFIVYSIYKNFNTDFMLSICLLSIFLRSLTDTVLFSGYHYEYIFIYLVLFSFKKKLLN